MSVIRWEDPPEPSLSRLPERSRLNHAAIAACLRRKPGAWALVDEGSAAYTISSTIRTGQIAAYHPGGSFEAVGRVVHGMARLYVRFVADPSAVGGGRSDNPNPDLGGAA